MPNLQASDNPADIVTLTLKELGRAKWTDLTSDYPDTLAMKRLIKKGKITFDDGYEAQFNLMTATNGSARAVGLAYTSVVDAPNIMTTGSVPWRHVTWNWMWERRLVKMNSGSSRIVDMVKTQRYGAMGDAVKMFENQLWRVPAVSDNITPYGLPYYIVKSNTAVTTNDGFNGSVPSGYTTVAGLNPTTYPRWRNYATQYTTVSKDDLIRKWRRAATKTAFKPLVDDTPTYNTGDDYGFYTNYFVIGTLEEILEAQNENLGKDIASMDGEVVFRRVPVVYAAELELDTTNPIYGVNWGVLGAMGLKGEWMLEKTFNEIPTQPTVGFTNVDCTWNLICRDRRRNFVLSTNTTMSY